MQVVNTTTKKSARQVLGIKLFQIGLGINLALAVGGLYFWFVR